MAIAAYEPNDLAYTDQAAAVGPESDFDSHVQTYRTFIRYVLLFAAHVAVVLALLAYFLM